MPFRRALQLLLPLLVTVTARAQVLPGDAVVTRSVLPHLNGPLYVTVVPANGTAPVDLYTGSGRSQSHDIASGDGEFYVPLDLPSTKVIAVSSSGAGRDVVLVDAQPTGLARDASGNLYVGLRRATDNIIKVSTDGHVLATYTAPGEDPYAIDVERDQCTLVYLVRTAVPNKAELYRHDVCAGTSPSRLAQLAGDYTHLVILPGGDLLLLSSQGATRLTASGAPVRLYTVAGVTTWRGLALSPAGDSVFVAVFRPPNGWELLELELASGAVRSVRSLPQTLTTGVAISGGWRAATASVAAIPTLHQLGVVALLVAIAFIAACRLH